MVLGLYVFTFLTASFILCLRHESTNKYPVLNRGTLFVSKGRVIGATMLSGIANTLRN